VIRNAAFGLALALLAASAAAAVGPNYQRPDLALTPTYMAGPQPAATPPGDAWWDSFGDPILSRVVARALERNLDIAQARARVLQSRAQAHAAGAALAPQSAASAAAADQSQSLLSPIGEIGRHLPGYERHVQQYDLGVGASWEIDLFGGLHRQREAARARASASASDLAALRLTIAADAADAYLQVRAYQARLAVAHRQEAVQEELVALVQRRQGQGVASDRELNQARAALDGVRAGVPPLEAGLAGELNRLDILMGAQPGTWRAELAAAHDIPAAPAVSAAEGPPALMRRRPDVVAAEQRLVAANAGVGAALSDYYPKLSLVGLLGLESINAGELFTGDAVQHQVSAGLSWRLFDFGRVDAEVAQARGQYAEALAAWRATVLRAAGEVETSLSDLAWQEARARALAREIDDLTVARRQAQQAYESGVISLIEVRDADRDLLAASDELARTQADAARAAVAAYRALGGGWRNGTTGLLADGGVVEIQMIAFAPVKSGH